MITVKLQQGKKTLNLNDAVKYAVARNFKPPSLRQSLAYSGGTSSNRLNGADISGVRAENRQWAFGLHVFGQSELEVARRVRAVDDFLRSGTKEDPVYVLVLGNSNAPAEPIWGQTGVYLRYEVLSGGASLSNSYAVGGMREQAAPDCTVSLVIRPYAIGLEQLAASAYGGVQDDTIGHTDGTSRGVIVPPGVTNLITNPVFGSGTTGWTASAATLTATLTEDSEHVLFGWQSAFLQNTASLAGYYAQQLTLTAATRYVFSCYLRRPGGGEVTEDHIRMYYDGSFSISDIFSVGGGWYRAYASFTGSGALAYAGLQVNAMISVIMTGFQVEEKNAVPYVPSPLAVGSWPGHAWSGTRHQSTSVRTAGRIRLPTTALLLGVSEGSIRACLVPDNYASSLPTGYIFDAGGASAFSLRFDTAANTFIFTIGASTITSAAQTWVARTPVVIHVTWSQGTFKLYVNGALEGTLVATSLPVIGAYLYIGSDNAGANQFYGTLAGFTIFDAEFSLAQVTDDYTNVIEMLTDDHIVDWIPWMWTKDGDNIVDNSNPPNNLPSSLDNYCVVGGVPGNGAAYTKIVADASINLNANGVELFLTPVEPYSLLEMSALYGELSGTADATASGGQFERQSIGSVTPVLFTRQVDMSRPMMEALYGREVMLLTRMQDAGAAGTLQLRLIYQIGVTVTFFSEYRSVSPAAYFLLRATNPILFKDIRQWGVTSFPVTAGFYLQGLRSTGVAANVDVDFYQVVTRPYVYIYATSANMTDKFTFNSRTGEAMNVDGGIINSDVMYVEGDRRSFEVEGGRWNYVIVGIGALRMSTGVAVNDSIKLDFYVTPRWGLI